MFYLYQNDTALILWVTLVGPARVTVQLKHHSPKRGATADEMKLSKQTTYFLLISFNFPQQGKILTNHQHKTFSNPQISDTDILPGRTSLLVLEWLSKALSKLYFTSPPPSSSTYFMSPFQYNSLRVSKIAFISLICQVT